MRVPYLFTSLFIGLLLLSYNNCGQGFKLDGEHLSLASLSGSLSLVDNTPWPEVNCSGSSREKIEIFEEKKPTLRMPEELINDTLTEEDNLLITLNNECYQMQGPKSFLSKSLERLTPDAKMTTYRWPVYEVIQGQDIYQEALQDLCITEVDRDRDHKLFNQPTDPSYGSQRYLSAVNHGRAFSLGFNPQNGINKPVRLAIIDSGLDVTHPDIESVVLKENGSPVVLNGIDNTNNVSDSGFHGTHVAGIAAAKANNGQGISGVAGLYANLLAVRTSNDGTRISESAVANGIRWAVDKGAKVINLSLGGPANSQAWVDAIRYAEEKGVLLVIAAGNDGRQITPTTPTYPAMLTAQFTNIITVGSYDVESQGRSSFSNFSRTYVDIMAPGSDGSRGILSTIPISLSASGYAASTRNSAGTLRPINGTSMAAPVVAGAAALVAALAQSRGFQISATQIKSFFEKGSVINSDFQNLAKNGKQLDIDLLLKAVAEDTGLPLDSNQDRSQARGIVGINSSSPSVGLPSGKPLTLSVEKSMDSSLLLNYQWYKDGQPIAGATQSTYEKTQVSLRDKGVYQVIVSSGLSKQVSPNIKVNVQNCL